MLKRFNALECYNEAESNKILTKLNEMQVVLERSLILSIDNSWQIFYDTDEENDDIKGFVILFAYNRMPCDPDYNTGRLAEIELFTFPKYRHQNVCSNLVKQVIEFSKENGIDIVADCLPSGYKVLKSLDFKDSTEKRVWMHLS